MFAFAATLLAGCSPSSSVSGQVTYDGEPVKKGWIKFTPADGIGPDAAVEIKNGYYHLGSMLPGPKIVNVEATRDVNFASSSEEMAKRYAEAKAKGDMTGLVDPADIIPYDAEGNNQKINVAAGSHKLDFALKKPAKK
jgi:hypothetical protein